MKTPKFIPLPDTRNFSAVESAQRAAEFLREMQLRRSVRQFSNEPVPRAMIETCLMTAGTSPSGANQQPWSFVAVQDHAAKREIRLAAEAEECEFYSNRAPEEWLAALAPLGTNAKKPYLEIAPWLIAIFVQRKGTAPDGSEIKHYYPIESVGIATGILISALHQAGLATLTHTPSPMGFLNRILRRPEHERPFLLLVIGHPTPGATVPDIHRKPLDEIATFV